MLDHGTRELLFLVNRAEETLQAAAVEQDKIEDVAREHLHEDTLYLLRLFKEVYPNGELTEWEEEILTLGDMKE